MKGWGWNVALFFWVKTERDDRLGSFGLELKARGVFCFGGVFIYLFFIYVGGM